MAVVEDNNSPAQNFPSQKNTEEEWVHMLMDGGTTVSPPWNFSSPSVGIFDTEVQQSKNGKGKDIMQQRNDDHFFNEADLCFVDGLINTPMESSPLPSDDSLGSFEADSLRCDNAEHSVVEKLQNWQTFQPCSKCFGRWSPRLSGLPGVTAFLLHLDWLCQNMVVELGNGDEVMRLTIKKSYLEVDFSSEENYAGSMLQAPERWGEMTERSYVSRRYAFCSKTHCSNMILELLGVAVRVLLYLGIKNYTFGISMNNNNNNVNTKMQKMMCLGRTFINFLEMPHLHILQRLFLCNLERFALEGVAKLLSRKEIKVRYLQLGTACTELRKKHNYSVGMLPALDQAAECSSRGKGPSYDNYWPTPKSTATDVGIIAAISNSSRKKDNNDGIITRESLEQLFGKSRADAAKTLKVSISTLKRECRKFGIAKWPIQKRKMMANCPLNQKQAAPKKRKGNQQCPEITTLLQGGNSTLSVKVTYKNNTVRFPLSFSSTMKYLEEQLETRFKIPLDNFCIEYQDEEDEWISVMCDSDLMYCMDVLRSFGKTVIRMKLTPKYD